MNRSGLEKEYLELGNELPTIYPSLNFKNHCYWRIALDNAVGDQWNKKLVSPAYKNLSNEQLQQAVELMQSFQQDAYLLQEKNKLSLQYRGKL